ncbi:hypothetical protein IIE18_10875 [Pseudomonas sp. V1]|uniref:hypothetical protein n=1 Tax=Pseudomonas arcuscaelestis TaxID=2710591 RepID=UPI00193F3C78|nr:hypothetical protein [Pseudomonas arcuscaelestis]MBM3105644.1 hypothetical protein [Pseudomonas arcuscaelestis]
MKRLTTLALPLLHLPVAAAAADLIEFNKPINSELRVETVICKSPESLFLLYEGGYLAMKGGGKQSFEPYYQGALNSLTSVGECAVEKSPQQVKVTAMATLTNPLKAPNSTKIYGRFEMKGLRRDVFAISEDLPGLGDAIKAASQLEKKNSQ